MTTENLSTLKIHKLSQEQYDRELEAGRIDENAIYLTPDEGCDIEIDPSLKIEGMAADAKAVGDAINNLSIDIAEAGSIDIDLDGSNEGETNPINADTLGGFSINDLVKKTEMLIPSVSDSDNGKFLKVVDGTPAWETVPSAEEVSF